MISLALDIGGTQLRAALIDEGGRLIATARAGSAGASAEEMAVKAARLKTQMEGDSGLRATCAGVGIAAMVPKNSDRLAVAPNLGWRDVPFFKLTTARVGT